MFLTKSQYSNMSVNGYIGLYNMLYRLYRLHIIALWSLSFSYLIDRWIVIVPCPYFVPVGIPLLPKGLSQHSWPSLILLDCNFLSGKGESRSYVSTLSILCKVISMCYVDIHVFFWFKEIVFRIYILCYVFKK